MTALRRVLSFQEQSDTNRGIMNNAPSKTSHSRQHGSLVRFVTRAACSLVFLILVSPVFAATPVATVDVSPSPITSANDNAVFTITLSEPTARGIGIAFFMSGGARSGSDYVLFGNFDGRGHIVIPAGDTSATVTLHTLFKDPSQPRLDATLNLLHGGHYRLGSPRHARLFIELP
jgi:hypothetical protein